MNATTDASSQPPNTVESERKGRKRHILVAEDDDAICKLLEYNLTQAGFVVAVVTNGNNAIDAIRSSPPHLVLLDWMLPGCSGLEVCRWIKKREATRDLPVIMVTARGEEDDILSGLNVGVEDYIVKPFRIRELMARVNRSLRRAERTDQNDDLVVGSLRLNTARFEAFRKKHPLGLSLTEFRLLHELALGGGKALSRERLLTDIWGIESEIDERSIDVVIRRLRLALNRTASGKLPDAIRTVRGVGYALNQRALIEENHQSLTDPDDP